LIKYSGFKAFDKKQLDNNIEIVYYMHCYQFVIDFFHIETIDAVF